MVIGADPEFFDADKYEANGNATLKDNGILIKFKKGKYISGMEIACKRGDESEFIRIQTITLGTVGCLDDRPNLVEGEYEERTYRTWAFIDNDKIGGPSPEFKIVCLIPPLPPEEKI